VRVKLLLACGVFCVALNWAVSVRAQAPFTSAAPDAGADSGAAPDPADGGVKAHKEREKDKVQPQDPD
jgi:hypothetical protein